MKARRGKHEGTVYQRADGRWVASVRVAGVEGGSNRPTVYGRTRAEALRKLHRLRLDLHLGNAAEAATTRMGAYLDAWVEVELIRPTTKETYEAVVRLYLKPNIGHLTIAQITPLVIRNLLATLRNEGTQPHTVQRVYDTLRWALSRAVSEELLARNPCSLVPRPKAANRTIVCLDREQIARFLEAAKEERLYALYVLALTLGLRQGELFGLSEDDIDWERKTVTIRRSVHQLRGRRIIGDLKTTTSRRTLRLSNMAVEALEEHLEGLASEGLPKGRRLHPQPDGKLVSLMFVNKAGQPLSRPAVREWSFHRILQRACLPRIRFHDLRHTAASLFLAEGFSLLTVSRMLGHAKPSTTLNVYGHLLSQDDARLAEVLDALFGGG